MHRLHSIQSLISRNLPALVAVGLLLNSSVAQVSDADPPARTGEQIYQTTCALCHGATGDGKGIVSLDRPARSFLEGAFSFGNTPEAVLRTVKSGIGGTPMPGFGGGLSDEELRKVVAYVIAMGPEQPAAAGQASVMVVGDRPLAVRGHLPPVAAGAPEHPRGLLIGTVDGLSWEYRTIDLALLAVRQGEFVDRKDWGGRGGAPLQPLGKIAFLSEVGKPKPSFWDIIVHPEPDEGGGTRSDIVPLRQQLVSTTILNGRATVQSKLQQATGAVAQIQQWGEAFSLPSAAGFVRHFKVGQTGEQSRARFAFRLASRFGRNPQIQADGWNWIWIPDAGNPHVLGIHLPGHDISLVHDANGLMLVLPSGRGALEFSIAVLPMANLETSTWQQIREELSK